MLIRTVPVPRSRPTTLAPRPSRARSGRGRIRTVLPSTTNSASVLGSRPSFSRISTGIVTCPLDVIFMASPLCPQHARPGPGRSLTRKTIPCTALVAGRHCPSVPSDEVGRGEERLESEEAVKPSRGWGLPLDSCGFVAEAHARIGQLGKGCRALCGTAHVPRRSSSTASTMPEACLTSVSIVEAPTTQIPYSDLLRFLRMRSKCVTSCACFPDARVAIP